VHSARQTYFFDFFAAALRLRTTAAARDAFGGTFLPLLKLLGHSTTATTHRHYDAWARDRQSSADQDVMDTWPESEREKTATIN
jgi:integrase